MLQLAPVSSGDAHAQILCLGAHCDDIEIGCGGTILKLLSGHTAVDIHWVVFSSDACRKHEARESAAALLGSASRHNVVVKDFRDGFFPYVGADIKSYFEELKRQLNPDVIFTHYREDRHQDHRVISDLTWNTFRDHLILEYEILKYDGDLGAPNCYVHLDDEICRKKIDVILSAFKSQRSKPWFTEDAFRGLMRLRGIEARATNRYAEAFYARKILLESVVWKQPLSETLSSTPITETADAYSS